MAGQSRTKPGGARAGAGTRDDVRWIELDEDARQMLNILVKEARMLRGSKLSHRQIVKELIAERYGGRDAAWAADACDDSGDVIAPPNTKGSGL